MSASLLKPFSGRVTSSLAVVWETLAVAAAHICHGEEVTGRFQLSVNLVGSNFLKHLILQLIKHGWCFLYLDFEDYLGIRVRAYPETDKTENTSSSNLSSYN